MTSASGQSSQSRMPATDTTDRPASTRSSMPPSISSAMESMSLVSRATTRPDVYRSWKPTRQPLEVVVDPLPQVEQDGLPDAAGQGEEAAFGDVLQRRGHGERHRRPRSGRSRRRRRSAAGSPGRCRASPGRARPSRRRSARAAARSRSTAGGGAGAAASREGGDCRPQPDDRRLVGRLGGGPLGVVVGCDAPPGLDVDAHATRTVSSSAAAASSSAAADSTLRYAGTVASSSEWRAHGGDRAVEQQRDPVGERDRRRPVHHQQRRRIRAAPGPAPLRPAPRCARRALTAGRRAPAPRGVPSTARASARRCRCPPDSDRPCSPTRVSRPHGSSWTKPACATSMAARISASLASGRPSARFSRTLIENRVGSSNATPTICRSEPSWKSRTSRPSIVMRPAVTS